MTAQCRNELIQEAGGEFVPDSRCASFLREVIAFATHDAKHLGLDESTPSVPTDIIVTSNKSFRCSADLVEGRGLILIPLGLFARIALLYRILSKPHYDYEPVIFVDGEWHGDVPGPMRKVLEDKPFHPLVKEIYRDDISIPILLSRCADLEEGLIREQYQILVAILRYVTWFLIEHERAHIERHIEYAGQMNAMYRTNYEEWLQMKNMMETDADACAAQVIGKTLVRDLSAKPANPLGDCQHEGKVADAIAVLGIAVVSYFSLVVPQLRSITKYDSEAYSHPQVRLVTLNAGLGRGIQLVGLSGQIAMMLVGMFTWGATKAMSGLVWEMIEFNKRMKEHNPDFDSAAFKPVTSLILGHISQPRIHERACAKMDFRRAFVDSNYRFSFKPIAELPTSCRRYSGLGPPGFHPIARDILDPSPEAVGPACPVTKGE